MFPFLATRRCYWKCDAVWRIDSYNGHVGEEETSCSLAPIVDVRRSPSLKWVAVPSGTTRWTLKQLCYFFVCFRDGSQWCGFYITLKSGATVNDCQLISLQQQGDVFGLCCSAPCPGSLNSAEYQSGGLYKYYHLQWYSVKRNPKMNSKDWSKYLSLLCHPIKESKTNPYRLLKPKCVAFIYPFLPSWWCNFTFQWTYSKSSNIWRLKGFRFWWMFIK